MIVRSERYGSVDDIVGLCHPANLSGGSGLMVVKG